MKKFFLLSVAATLISSLSFATIRRVGFFGPAVSGVDYNTLQIAHDASSAGDTIMMIPGSNSGVSITKQLVIIGPGYLLDPSDASFPGNTGLQANPNTTTANGIISFGSGSSNTQVLGCTFSGASFTNSGISGILIKRCRFTYSNNVTFLASANNITFQQCLFEFQIRYQGSTNLTNLAFLNCLFTNTSYIEFNGIPSSSGLISNCIFSGGAAAYFSGSAWQVSNCISSGVFGGSNIVFNNNIGTSNQFPTGNGNQQNKAWNTIFTLTGSYDGKYALKAGSPAIGAGLNGTVATDCGIFGGATPYRLSGIPSVPTIYALTSPQGTIPAGNTVQINLSTRSNN